MEETTETVGPAEADTLPPSSIMPSKRTRLEKNIGEILEAAAEIDE